jgi:hypothetical protein
LRPKTPFRLLLNPNIPKKAQDHTRVKTPQKRQKFEQKSDCLLDKDETASPTKTGWWSAMKGAGLGFGFVIVFVAQGHAVIIVFNLVIIQSKKKFTERLPFGFTIAALKILQPSLLSEPL